MNRLMIFVVLAILATMLSPSAFSAEKTTLYGTITAYEDDDGALSSMELEASTMNGAEYYSVVMNEKTKKLFPDYSDVPVQVTGSIVMQDDEEWFSIDSCRHVVTGTLHVNRDENDKIESVSIESDDWGDIGLKLNDAALKCADHMNGKMIRTIGQVRTAEEDQTFELQEYCDFIHGRGVFEIDENEDGQATSIRFVLYDSEGNPMHKYDIFLDAGNKELADRFSDDDVELSGILENKKNKQWLVIQSCTYYASDEDEGWSDDEEEESTDDEG